MKYKLNVAFGDYQVGHVFEEDRNGGIDLLDEGYLTQYEIALMLHTHFLSVWEGKPCSLK